MYLPDFFSTKIFESPARTGFVHQKIQIVTLTLTYDDITQFCPKCCQVKYLKSV